MYVTNTILFYLNTRLFEPDNEPCSTRLESDSEDEASESDVQEVDIEEVQGEDVEPERKTTKALVSRLSFYRCMLKTFFGRCDGSLGIIRYSLSFVVQ